MALLTANLNNAQVLNRKQKIARLREKHELLFKLEGLEGDAKFIPKMAYIPYVGGEKVISLFPSEIQSGEDLYTEFVSSEYDPEDPERTLWKWSYNPHWDTEYEKTEPHAQTGHCRYLIPVEELIDVAEWHRDHQQSVVVEEEKSILDFSELPDPDDDAPLSKMTLRDKCAIDWKLPVSRKKWLNDLIKQNFE